MTLDSSISAYTAACVDCNTLPGCATSELTAQCTDQCVVIACSDPDHGEASCGGGGQHAQCVPIGNEIYNCNDCYGFDEFVSMFVFQQHCLNLTFACSYNVVTTTNRK